MLTCAGPGVREALAAHGLLAVDDGPADAVVVGFHREFDYDGARPRLGARCGPGARFVATNLDATYPVPGGLIPGAGSLVAAVATAAGSTPEVAGKPEAADRRPHPRAVRRPPGWWWATGRRPTARWPPPSGWPFALVLSGVTAAVAPPGGEAIPDPRPPFVGRRPRRARAGRWSCVRLTRPRSSADAAPGTPGRSGHGSTPTPTYPAPVTVRRRLDAELVRRGLLGSRRQAVEAIAAGRVRVAGSPAPAPARLVGAGEPIQLAGRAAAVRVARRREARRRARALRASTCAGRRALDAGASTGGFTDCLLQAGAAHVDAVDVGRGQLAWALRDDPRVTVRERTNVRAPRAGPTSAGRSTSPSPTSRSSRCVTVAPALARCTQPDGDFVLLVKPQFEAGRARIGKGGIVRDPDVHRAVLHEVRDGLRDAGLHVVDVMASPLRGADGNVEFLVRCDARGPALDDARLDDVVVAA